MYLILQPVFLLFVLFILSQHLTKKISQMFYHSTGSRHVAVYGLWLLLLPGTIIHELAHYLTAMFLLVPAGKISLLPHRDGETLQLGSVAIAKTDPIRRMLIGVAPFVTGIILLLTVCYFGIPIVTNAFRAPFPALAIVFVIFEVANTMFSSKKDLEGTTELLLSIAVFLVIGYLLGFRTPSEWLAVFESEKLKKIIEGVTIFIAIPVAIDAILLLLLRVVKQ